MAEARTHAAPPAGAPSVAVAFVRPALQRLGTRARQRVLAQAGIPSAWLEHPAARVPAQAFGALWLAVARELDDEFFGLDSRRLKVGSFAFIAHAAAAQATVGAALREMLRGLALALDDIWADLRCEGGTAAVVLHNAIDARRDGGAARRFAEETLLVMIVGLLGALAGARLKPLALHWAGAPAPHADEYRRMFGPRLHWHAPRTELHLEAGLLAAPVRLSRPALKRFLAEAPASVFLKQIAAPGWAQRLRQRLRHAEGAWPTLESVAAEWAISPPTLRRRLADEGRSFRQIKDELRQERAQQRLRNGDGRLEAIAAELGFDDARSFQRAFRRWTGQSPGAWRAAACG